MKTPEKILINAVTNFYWCCVNNDLTNAKKLYIEYSFNNNVINKAFIKSCEKSRRPILKFLLDKGADINVDNNYAIKRAVMRRDIRMLMLMRVYGAYVDANSSELIGYASYNGDLNIVKYLVACGVDVCADDNLAIKLAIRGNQPDVFRYLWNNGSRCVALQNETFRLFHYLLDTHIRFY